MISKSLTNHFIYLFIYFVKAYLFKIIRDPKAVLHEPATYNHGMFKYNDLTRQRQTKMMHTEAWIHRYYKKRWHVSRIWSPQDIDSISHISHLTSDTD